jgi:hypothetical protein
MVVMAGLAAALSGCSGSDGSTGGNPATGNDAGAVAGQFTKLASYDWKIDPGVEAYYCGFKTLTDDLYISDFRPIMPVGTHHVVVGYQDPGPPDGYVSSVDSPGTNGSAACTGVTFGDIFEFAATVGTQEFKMPEGVAEKIPAGKQLVFGLHVINTGTAPLSGTSGVEVVSPDASKVQNEAEVVAVTTFSLSVPPGKSTTNVTCTATGDTNLFAVSPHMHLTGTHMKSTAGPPPGTASTLFDVDYHFTDQEIKLLDPPLAMKQGDQIHGACDFENPSADTLTGGESTTKNEMCITFAYRYPALTPTGPTTGPPRGYCVN